MSANLRTLAVAAFRATAEAAYESGSKLRGRVLEITGVEAETQRFPVIGVGIANERQSQADVVPVNLRNAKPTASLTPDEAFDYLDRQDTALTNVDAMRGYGMTLGKACSRRYDAKIVAALQSWDTDELGAYTHPGVSESDMTITVARAGSARGKLDAAVLGDARSRLMDSMDGDAEELDLTLVYPADMFKDMAEEMKFASMDYMQGTQAPGVTKTGTFNEIYGMEPVFIGNKARQGAVDGELAKVGTADRAYVFARNAVGLAVGTTERKSVVEWVPQKRSWMVGAESNSGARRIQNAGIVVIQFTGA